MAILGISTNTRLLGLAIINREGLAEYKVYLHKSSWSPSKANLIVTSLEPCVRQYCIKRVVLSIPHKIHQTPEGNELMKQLKAYFRNKDIPIAEENVSSLFNLCLTGEKKGKKALMKALCLRYPELSYYYAREKRNKTKYYHKLFEAVAAATLHH